MSFDSNKQEILEKISIVDIVSEYVVLKRQGDKFWGLCPFHNEKTPSFSVTEEKNMFYCFGCHKGGSVFDFLMEIENISFIESFNKLADKAGVAIDKGDTTPEDRNKAALKELYNRITKSFNYILKNSESAETARQYLRARGVSDETLDKYMLGYAPSDRYWLYNFLRSKNYSDSFLEQAGIFSRKNRRITLFNNRLMFPVINNQQDTIAFSGRKLREEDWGGKYINSPETPIYIKGESLFGIHTAAGEIRKRKEFILVEGNFDVLAFSQAGFGNAVAPLGTAFTSRQARLLKRFALKGIIAYDGDSAGLEATLKTASMLEKEGIEHSVVSFPEGKDPSEILQKEGAGALNNMIKYPINTFEYLVNNAKGRYDVLRPEGKEAILKFVMPYIVSLNTEIKKEGCFRYLADAINVDIRSVISDFETAARNVNAPADKPVVSARYDEASMTIDLFFMMALIENRKSFEEVRNKISPDDLEDFRAREIFIFLEDMYRKDRLESENLTDHIKDESLKSIIHKKLVTGEFRINAAQIIDDGVKKIRQRNYEKKRREIEKQLRKIGADADGRDELQRLLGEKKYIDDELLRLKGN